MCKMYAPLHPGEIVKDALFADTQMTINEIAKRIHVNSVKLSGLINGQAGIDLRMAHQLSLFLSTSVEMWLNLQKDYDLWKMK